MFRRGSKRVVCAPGDFLWHERYAMHACACSECVCQNSRDKNMRSSSDESFRVDAGHVCARVLNTYNCKGSTHHGNCMGTPFLV